MQLGRPPDSEVTARPLAPDVVTGPLGPCTGIAVPQPPPRAARSNVCCASIAECHARRQALQAVIPMVLMSEHAVRVYALPLVLSHMPTSTLLTPDRSMPADRSATSKSKPAALATVSSYEPCESRIRPSTPSAVGVWSGVG